MNDQSKPNGSGLPYWNEEAEKRVPFHIWIATQYFHSLTEIWEFYRAQGGGGMPDELRKDMARIENVIAKDIREEAGQGGKFHDWYKEKMK